VFVVSLSSSLFSVSLNSRTRINELTFQLCPNYTEPFILQFFQDSDGSYAANIRLYDKDVLGPRPTNGTSAMKEREAKKSAANELAPGGGAASLFDFSGYSRVCSLIGPPEATLPKDRTKVEDPSIPGAGGARTTHSAWLMRLIEEIYDSRYAKDTADLKEKEGEESASSNETPIPFPTFVVEFITKRFGLRSLVDQHVWDLLYNTHKLRRDHTEVEVFARFLEEAYDPDDLLFFLYVRSVVQKELSYNFRSRWSELGRYGQSSSTPSINAPNNHGHLQMSIRDCSLVSRVVFGSESDPLYKTFMAMIERNMTGKKTAKSDSRTIDVNSFLHLAVVEYHETRPAEGAGGSTGSGNEEARLFREAAAAYDSRSGPQTGAPRPSPALLEALGETMHRSNEAYLDRAVAAASSLPREVQVQIRTEVQSQLESKVDAVLAAVITVGQGGDKNTAGAGPEVEELADKFSKLVAAGREDDASVSAFCNAVLSSQEISKTINPLVNLLVQYAQSRLDGSK
jgi:hypothetical protein